MRSIDLSRFHRRRRMSAGGIMALDITMAVITPRKQYTRSICVSFFQLLVASV